MPRMRRLGYGLLVLALLGLAGNAAAQTKNEGLADLDKAIDAKLNAQRIGDLGEVIQLCRSALKKGLDGEETVIAKSLLSSTLLQRAALTSTAIFGKGPPHPLWDNYRRLAMADLDEAVALTPELPEALLLIAKLQLLPDGNVEKATQSLDALLKIDLQKAGENAAETHCNALVLRAGLDKDAEKQLARLDEAVRLMPDNVEVLRARGLLQLDRGKSKLAIEDLKRVVELEPENGSILEALAMVQADLKQYDEALANLEKAQRLQPDSVTPLTVRAQIHVQQKELDKALADLNEARTLQPNNLIVLLLRASLYQEMDKPDKALADLDRALQLNPKFDRARRLKAVLLMADNRLKEGIRELETLAKASPNDVELQVQLAMLYSADKQPGKAIGIYTDVLKEHPDNASALTGRANALLGVGKHAEAITDYNKAYKLEPDESGMLNNFAWVLATSPDDALRDGKRAVKLAERACELTKHAEAHILSTLAAAYAEAGDFDHAVQWSKKALELGKKENQPPDLQDALAKELESFKQKRPWRERLEEGLGPQVEEKKGSP
ncbi:MAG: tetratricopeptide repeat protein [Pirellulales bacterium]|nr:tetratricopeptide repeat protein [Pirellulales bacterium]